jgi:outer membrane protein TolC
MTFRRTLPLRFATVSLAALLALAGCRLPPAPPADNAVGPYRDRSRVADGRELLPAEPPRPPAVAGSGPLELTVVEAVLLGLENNRALRVVRKTPPIFQTFEEQERAAFDPVLQAAASAATSRGQTVAGADTRTTTWGAEAGVVKRLPAGTDVEAVVSGDRTKTGGVSNHAVRAGLSITQALLRGRGSAVNLADLRQARIDTLLSQYELRGFAEALAAEIEATCWDYVLAERQIRIVEESLRLARQQLSETEQRVEVGTLGQTEVAAARAEVALRQEALINARSELERTRLRLLRLTNPPGAGLWSRTLVLRATPSVPPVPIDAAGDHVKLALKLRSDLNEARLRVRRGDLELVKTKNGLLPRLDLFLSLGKTGYANSFQSAVGNVGDKYYDAEAGLTFEIPLGNRGARAEHERARLTREQLADSVANLEQLVQIDVRTAIIEVKRAAEQVSATTATRKAQEEKTRAETEKFKVGKSTSILVATAQRDLLASQIAEVQAAVNYLQALIDLHRLDGSLLLRRGIAAPGGEPPAHSVR